MLRAIEARPSDVLYVVRFLADGTVTMAKPCELCQNMINSYGVKKVYYTDWEGNWNRL